MMRVIINADDFGKSPQRNKAIDDACFGILTTARMPGGVS